MQNTTDIETVFDQHAVMHTIGATLGEVATGAVDIRLPFRADLGQQDGFVHAGIITLIVDSACGLAALTQMPTGARVLTVEFKVNFLSPAIGESFLAQGRVLKAGRTISTTRGDVYALQEGKQKLVAAMQATMYCVQS